MLDFGLPDVLNAATNLVVCGAACAGLKFSGFRVGPIRAVTLAIKSRWFIRTVSTNSMRTSQVARLEFNLKKDSLREKLHGSYTVVVGEEGVGKTCMIDTCLKGMKGIIRVTIPPSTRENEVASICLSAIIGGPDVNFFDPVANANRVLYWYNFLFRGQMPVIVLNVTERWNGEQRARLTVDVVRTLTRMGINVVVNGSQNSLAHELSRIFREIVIEVEGLSREEVRSMPQLKNLFTVLDEAKLSSVVLDLLGGNPSLYITLFRRLKDMTTSLQRDTKKPSDLAATAVTEILMTLLDQVHREAVAMTSDQHKFAEIFALLKDHQQISLKEMEDRYLNLSSSCRILRAKGGIVLPSRPIAALYFKTGSKYGEAVRQAIEEAREE